MNLRIVYSPTVTLTWNWSWVLSVCTVFFSFMPFNLHIKYIILSSLLTALLPGSYGTSWPLELQRNICKPLWLQEKKGGQGLSSPPIQICSPEIKIFLVSCFCVLNWLAGWLGLMEVIYSPEIRMQHRILQHLNFEFPAPKTHLIPVDRHLLRLSGWLS